MIELVIALICVGTLYIWNQSPKPKAVPVKNCARNELEDEEF